MSDPSDPKKERDLWLWGILALAALFRLTLLSHQPPHSDEGVVGWFADQIIANGYFKYDPTNYHGPFHYYLVFFFKILFGRNLWALRLPSAILGVGVVYLLTQFKPHVGRPAAYTAATWAAVSPALVYFSRFTFETDMLFFHVLAVLGYLRHTTVRDRTSLFLMGVGVAGMMTVKEAWLLHFICFGLAVICVKTVALLAPSDAAPVEKRYTAHDVDLAAFGAILIVLTLYTGFFMYTSGVIDFFKPFTTWFQTSTKGSGHDKPFFYWTDLLRIYEWPAFIGLLVTSWWILRTVGSLRLRRGETGASLTLGFVPTTSAPLRLLGIYGFGLLLAYSFIPYKTPWLVVQFLWPFLFVAGEWFSRLSHRAAVMAALVVLLAAANTWPSIRLSFFRPTDEQEKYVYVQTFPALMEVYEKVAERVKADPNLRHQPINIIMKGNWPMPWLFGDYTRVGYHSSTPPANPDAVFLLVDVASQATVESNLQRRYFTRRFRYSSYQEDMVAYFDAKVFAGSFPPDMPVYERAPIKPGPGLLVRVYPNAAWQGEPAFEKVMPNIDLSDAARPLAPPVSIVYSGEIFIPESGETAFYLSSDDGAELVIGGQRLISDLAPPPRVRLLSRGSRVFKAGWHPIEVHHYDVGFGILAQLSWQRPSMTASEIIPPDRFRWGAQETKPSEQGLLARYYTNAMWQGEPIFTKTVANIDTQLDTATPAAERPLPAPFGVIYSGELFIPESGQIFFYLSSDDGAELMVDGRVFISDLAPPAVRLRTSVAVKLDAGWHRLQVRHYDIGGGILTRLEWKLPSMAADETIPPSLFRTGTPEIKS